MARKLVPIVLAVLVFAGAVSCELESREGFYFTNLSVISADFPETFRQGEVYTIEVRYQTPDACTEYQGFDVFEDALTTRTVTAIGEVRTDRACTQAIEEWTAILSVTVLYEGPYRFRFWTGSDDEGRPVYLEYTVPVESSAR